MLNGMLTVSQGVSRVNGVPLAICGAGDPFGSATNFLAGRGFGHGSQVIVTGSPGRIGDTDVFCMTDVQAAALAGDVDAGAKSATVEETIVVKAVRRMKTVKPAAKKKAAKKKAAAKKKTAKKRTGRKQASRRKSSRPARKARIKTAAARKRSRKR